MLSRSLRTILMFFISCGGFVWGATLTHSIGHPPSVPVAVIDIYSTTASTSLDNLEVYSFNGGLIFQGDLKTVQDGTSVFVTISGQPLAKPTWDKCTAYGATPAIPWINKGVLADGKVVYQCKIDIIGRSHRLRDRLPYAA